VTRKDADEFFVILLSDANLDIYGIHPSMLGRILGSDERCALASLDGIDVMMTSRSCCASSWPDAH
jgi:hypothetical protein